MTTPGGVGTRTGTGTRRSIRSKKSSTDSSVSGCPPKETCISPSDIYRSILEQQRELSYRKKNPGWILMSPRTGYELRSESTDWVYFGKTGKEEAIMVMGIPLRTVDWMPDGIVVVTDTFMEDPRPEWIKGTFTSSMSGASKVYDEMTKWWKPLSDYKVTFDDTPLTGTFTSTGETLYFGHATTSGAATPESQSPEEWSDPVEESQEPDPDSIYGRSLAKVRAESKGKR